MINLTDCDIPKPIFQELTILLEKHKGAFADSNEALSLHTDIVATVRTETDEPIYSKSYPYPLTLTEFLNNEIENLLDNGIIRPFRSTYNNPIWIVDKKGLDETGMQKKRLVVDFRKLNSKATSERYPIPDTMVIMSNLENGRYFTTLDLKSGFHRINLKEGDRKTTFNINNGKFKFCRLPFGLKNAPGFVQKVIDDGLKKIGKTCHVYIDDIIIFSPNAKKTSTGY